MAGSMATAWQSMLRQPVVRHSLRQARALSTTAAAPVKKKGFIRRLLTGVVGATAVSSTGFYVYCQYDEGMDRSRRFWLQAFPIYMHYRWMQSKVKWTGMSEEEEDQAFEELHDKYAPQAEKIVMEMKGMYLKNAQLVSTRDEFLPRQYMEFCKRTQNEVATEFGPGEARRVVERDLGPISKHFEWFDDEVVGAASIGEVHRARLHGGREVVVKIQYPGIEKKFRSDLTTIKNFSKLAQPQHVKPLEEIEKQFLTEFDYRGEAENLKLIRDNIMPVFGDRVYIPEVHMDLCTREVMVMDYVAGERLIDGLRNMYEKFAAREGKTYDELEAEMKAKIKSGEAKLKTLEESKWERKQQAAMITASDYIGNTGRALYNWTVGWVAENKPYQWTDKSLTDLGATMELLNEVHAHEILVDGAFNGDPHPGNILLCPDGRLGLIDYGQVKRLPDSVRVQYARIIYALAHGNKDDVLREYKKTGVQTRYMKDDILYKMCCFWNDRDTDDITGGRNVQTFMDWMQEQDPLDDVIDDYVMPARVNVLMRGMANGFGLRIRTAPLWAPVAERVLRDSNIDPAEVARGGLEDARRRAEAEARAKAEQEELTAEQRAKRLPQPLSNELLTGSVRDD